MTQKYHEIFRISSCVEIHGVTWFNMASWRFLPDIWKMYFLNAQTSSLNCCMWQILLHVQHGLLERCLLLDSGSFCGQSTLQQVQYLLQRRRQATAFFCLQWIQDYVMKMSFFPPAQTRHEVSRRIPIHQSRQLRCLKKSMPQDGNFFSQCIELIVNHTVIHESSFLQ